MSCFACGSDRVEFRPGSPASEFDPGEAASFYCRVCGHHDTDDAQSRHDSDAAESRADDQREIDW